jgi:hypothetical protein
MKTIRRQAGLKQMGVQIRFAVRMKPAFLTANR